MKKLLTVALVAVMVLGLFAGCQPADEGKSLTFWSMWSDGEPQAVVIKEAAAAYEQKTGIKVNIEFKGRDVNQQLSAALESGEKIDIIEDDYQRIAQVYNKYTADLTDMAKAANYKGYDCLNNQVIEWAGHLNSIVEQPQVGGVFYNKDAFAKAGITAEPKTWAEFLDVCAKLKTAGYAPLALDSAYADFTFYHQLVRHVGEKKIEELAMNGGWGKEAGVVAAAQEIIDFVKAGNLADGAPDEYPASQNKVGFGEAAMVVCANYVTAETNNNCGVQLNWGLFNYPMVEGSDNASAYAGANSLAITSYSENKQAAFDFIMMLTTGEYDQKMATAAAQIPADPTNKAPAHLTGTVETLLAADAPMTWCAGINANSQLLTSFKSLFVEIYEGKYESGEAFCAALDALYK